MTPEIIPADYQDQHGNTIRVIGLTCDRLGPRVIVRKQGKEQPEAIGEDEFSKTYTLAK